MRWILVLLLALTSPLFAESPHEHHDSTQMSSSADTYTCPMHPNIRQDKAGTCPICGMDLVKVTKEERKEELQAKTYTCPMHPNIVSDKPGKCPICGMDLVPKVTTSGSVSKEGLKIDVATRRIAGIETETLELSHATQTVRAVGTIDFDESRMASVSAYFDGRVEKLFANYTGVQVNQGEHLASVYSPDLYSAQVEYLQALKGGSLQGRLVEGAKKKLEELGMSDAQIKALHRSGQALSRMTIFSPVSGTVIAKDVVEGRYVKTGESLFKVANLSTLWLLLDIYPEEAANLRYGLKVDVKVDSHPEQSYRGRISFIDPVVDKQKRTVRVRVELPNPEGKLRPGEYASARIAVPLGGSGTYFDPDLAGKWISPMHPEHISDKPGQCPVCGMNMVPSEQFGFAKEAPTSRGVITVPRNAVLTMGSKSAVYVEGEGSTFMIREVVVGQTTSDGRIHIIKGLEAGESIATQGVFLLDSQMQLNGKTSLIDITGGAKVDPHAGHNH